MPTIVEGLTKAEIKRCAKIPLKCRRLNYRVKNIAEYFAVISGVMSKNDPFWFRGHESLGWKLEPLALRYGALKKRTRALELISEFMRVAEIKLSRPPQQTEKLKWIQIARHYGLPTRLLDWTENASVGLFFACKDPSQDGVVFMLNPIQLNRLTYPSKPRIFDANSDGEVIDVYLKLDAKYRQFAKNPIAINPVWNSERLMVQRGVFTLHGARFDLSGDRIPSLVALPILREYKEDLRKDLQRVGIDEMTVFPELEHACAHLKTIAGLDITE
jgi:hypothetical protein